MGHGNDSRRCHPVRRTDNEVMRLCFLLFLLASPASAWWCEGHEIVALIAESHLSPAALAGVNALLKSQPIDAAVRRFCQNRPDDLMADASSWADDVKKSEQTGAWHYMDVPLSQKHGDLEPWCKPVGPLNNGEERSGCILSALRYNLNILHNDKESDTERAKALRYLIHLVGDLHQPLHTTANNDQGGNCTPIQFFSDPKITNLHSVWDGMIVNRDLLPQGASVPDVARKLDSQFVSKLKDWTKHGIDFDKWAMESHELAQKVVYGKLEPRVTPEAFNQYEVCKDHAQKYTNLHIKTDTAYQEAAAPIVEEQLAKAGYRLAEVLNQIW